MAGVLYLASCSSFFRICFSIFWTLSEESEVLKVEVDESDIDVECLEGGVVKSVAKEISSRIYDDVEIVVSFL